MEKLGSALLLSTVHGALLLVQSCCFCWVSGLGFWGFGFSYNMGVDVLHLLVPQQQQQLQVFLFMLLIGTCIIILAALADLGVAAPAASKSNA
jgi:TRAP-type C4-dicarboxylate transport system permease small subunit